MLKVISVLFFMGMSWAANADVYFSCDKARDELTLAYIRDDDPDTGKELEARGLKLPAVGGSDELCYLSNGVYKFYLDDIIETRN